MATVTIDKNPQIERKLYKNSEENLPDTVNDASLPYPEEELITMEEFKAHFEKRLYERLGLKITL